MSANGEIEIAVTAEGAEDAAAELANAGGGGEGGGGGLGGGGGGGLRTAVTGGLVGGLLSEALGPLLEVLQPMLDILSAFLAPVAAMLLRLLSPVLRTMIQLLPAWMGFIQNVEGWVGDAVEFLQNLPGQIWAFLSSGWSWLSNGAEALGKKIKNKLKSLFNGIKDAVKNIPQEIARVIANAVPSIDVSDLDRQSRFNDTGDKSFTGNDITRTAEGKIPGLNIYQSGDATDRIVVEARNDNYSTQPGT